MSKSKVEKLHANLVLYLTLLLEIIKYTYERITLRINYPERDIRGSIAIVTGANSGIGKATVFELAKRGATVVLACRNLTDGRKAIEEIEKNIVLGKLDLIELDLSDLASIRKFASKVKTKYSKVDILVNNAGIFDTSGIWKKTTDGFESHFGVNHLGHFLLTNLLLSHLKKGNSSRIINVASSLQIFAAPYLNMKDLMLENTKDWSLFNALPYGLSKYCNSLFTKELNRRLDGTNVITCSLCPGYVETGLFRYSSRVMQMIVYWTVKLFGLTTEEGCRTTVYLAISADVPEGGKFYRLNKIHKTINEQLTMSENVAEELWIKSAKLVQLE